MAEAVEWLRAAAVLIAEIRDHAGRWRVLVENLSVLQDQAVVNGLLHQYDVLDDAELTRVVRALERGEGQVSFETCGDHLLQAGIERLARKPDTSLKVAIEDLERAIARAVRKPPLS